MCFSDIATLFYSHTFIDSANTMFTTAIAKFSKLNTGVQFIIKFLVLFGFFYYFNVAAIGITDPKNYYNDFIATNLNYLDWLRSAILHTSNLITRAVGLNTYVYDDFYLRVRTGGGVRMAHACLGCGIMSFWCAFVLANQGSVKQKIRWLFFGLGGIFIVNCTRISLLVIANHKRWPLFKQMDHHTFFNYGSYIVVFILIAIYIKQIEKPVMSSNNASPNITPMTA